MKKSPDILVIFITFILMAIGVIMIFSSSSATCSMLADCNYDPYFYLKRQLVWAGLGTLCFIAAVKADVVKLGRFSFLGILLCFILLVLVLVPGIGIETMGARRWLGYGNFTFQPAEFAKVIVVIYVADYLSRRGEKILELKRLIPILLVVGLIICVVELEPDLGTALSLGATLLAMLFMGGANIYYLAGIVCAGVGFTIVKILSKAYRMQRMLAFLNPWQDSQGSGYHVVQSLIAIGSGGALGLGIGQSRQKFFYLPEQYTDFIFAIIGEELGLWGTFMIVGLFVLLLYRGFKIATQASSLYLRLLAAGCTFMLAFQAFMNMGVVVGLLPCTGIPLPFISFGGSSLLCCMILAGLLVNVSRLCPKRSKDWDWEEDEDEEECDDDTIRLEKQPGLLKEPKEEGAVL